MTDLPPTRIDAWQFGGMRTWSESPGPRTHRPTSYVHADIADAMLDLLKKIAAGDGQDEVIDDVLELIERAET